MMNIESLSDEFIKNLKQNEYFDEIKIIKAYPNTAYSGEIKSVVVAVGTAQINVEPYEIGYNGREVNAGIFADIFVPVKSGDSKAVEVLKEICKACENYNIISIKTQRITYSSNSNALVLKTEITFGTSYDAGGESGE